MVKDEASLAPRPASDWTEENGTVLWWTFPITEPPYVGSPLDLGHEVVAVLYNWKGESIGEQRVHVGGWPGYHTHWTPLTLPDAPTADASGGETDA